MRDIRSDLQERANSVEEEIRAFYADCEKMIEQLQKNVMRRSPGLRRSSTCLASSSNLRRRRRSALRTPIDGCGREAT